MKLEISARGSSRAYALPRTDPLRRLWGSPDALMLMFAGSAAEFAVNKAVDWLFWTNHLPQAPVKRFFETVRFGQWIAFDGEAGVVRAIRGMNAAHKGVERSRGMEIPQWAYRDVLFMWIDYDERAHEIVFGPMSEAERLEHFQRLLMIGHGLHIQDLPRSYAEYRVERQRHLREDTARSPYTDQLYDSYRRELGPWRVQILRDLQASLAPDEVARHLGLKRKRRVELLLRMYRHLPRGPLLRLLFFVLAPRRYRAELAALGRSS